MSNPKQVKVIKRTELAVSPAGGSHDREQTKRDALTVVTGWVSELRRKKARDSARPLQSLFGKAS
jgi:hypothetical protein